MTLEPLNYAVSGLIVAKLFVLSLVCADAQ